MSAATGADGRVAGWEARRRRPPVACAKPGRGARAAAPPGRSSGSTMRWVRGGRQRSRPPEPQAWQSCAFWANSQPALGRLSGPPV